MTSLVSWVNSWFYNPGTVETPTNDRMYAFVAATHLVGAFKSVIPIHKVQKNLHDLLTYLLLGWNPITAWVKQSEFPASDVEYTANARDTIKCLLDFQCNQPPVSFYPVLTTLTKLCDEYGSKGSALYDGERMTMLYLSLWLIERKFKTPLHDLGLVRNLLDLYYRSANSAAESMEIEYARSNHSLHYASWFIYQVDRLYRLHTPLNELKSDLAYIGWFISLIRATRMLKDKSRNVDWVTETTTILNKEVQLMRDAIDNASLKCIEDVVRDGPSLRSSARLFKLFKSRPPKVKILPVK